MEYHKTKDRLHVMNLLGHRNVENILIYTQLISYESDEYHFAVAKSVDEARKLLEEGFEYVRQKDDLVLVQEKKVVSKRGNSDRERLFTSENYD